MKCANGHGSCFTFLGERQRAPIFVGNEWYLEVKWHKSPMFFPKKELQLQTGVLF
jgi:hypothetical protein